MSAVSSRVTPHKVAGNGRLCASAGETTMPVKRTRADSATAIGALRTGLFDAPPTRSRCRRGDARLIGSTRNRKRPGTIGSVERPGFLNPGEPRRPEAPRSTVFLAPRAPGMRVCRRLPRQLNPDEEMTVQGYVPVSYTHLT